MGLGRRHRVPWSELDYLYPLIGTQPENCADCQLTAGRILAVCHLTRNVARAGSRAVFAIGIAKRNPLGNTRSTRVGTFATFPERRGSANTRNIGGVARRTRTEYARRGKRRGFGKSPRENKLVKLTLPESRFSVTSAACRMQR